MNSEKKFFIVRLQGGMCNQMFQYATGRGLAERNGFDLFVDTAGLNNKKHAHFNLYPFKADVRFADTEHLNRVLTPHYALKRALYKALKIPFTYARTHIAEKKFSFDQNVASTNFSAYFSGLWQSEKYFADISEKIRDDFQFRDESPLLQHPMYGEISACNAVSVHIRRGDYIKNKRYRRNLYVCRKSYFENAISLLRQRIDQPRFFIFSDDHKWVAENFQLGSDIKLVDSKNHFEDFFLMSRCKHNVISNSTFSWWSAWLNPEPSKIVIAPDMWFTPHAKVDQRDILPPSWTKIPCGYIDD